MTQPIAYALYYVDGNGEHGLVEINGKTIFLGSVIPERELPVFANRFPNVDYSVVKLTH